MAKSLVGNPAPALDVAAWLNGDEILPEDRNGKPVLMVFWAVWSQPSVDSLASASKIYEQFKNDGLQVMGVTRYYQFGWDQDTDSLKQLQQADADQENMAIERFLEKNDVPFPTIVTPNDSQTIRQFGVARIPQIVVIDRQGNVSSFHYGSTDETVDEIRDAIKQVLKQP